MGQDKSSQLPGVVLTGIKPTGYPHVGNYVGAIQPALERAKTAENSLFFIADYHALNQIQNSQQLSEFGLGVAATWLACGLKPDASFFYRQSDIPELFELATVLPAFTPKGWMNKAHAYKAAVAENVMAGMERDAGVNMGLYSYPILMAADILLFDARIVPVGSDQVQHVEIARDIAQRFNAHYGADVFVLPEYELQRGREAIPGTDGRKMSKSYGNVIPLFADREGWRSAVYGIVTDSTARHDPKPADGAPLFEIFAALAALDDRERLRADLTAGSIGWGEAKARLLELLEAKFADPSTRFFEFMAHPGRINDILRAGAERLRPRAMQKMEVVRSTIGLAGSAVLES